MTRTELEALMVKTFGLDWQSKVLVGPVSSFRLIDVYEEYGFEPPNRSSTSQYGLFQFDPTATHDS